MKIIVKVFALVLLIAIALSVCGVCIAEDIQDQLQDEVEDKLDKLDDRDLEQWFDEMNSQYKDALGGDFESAVKALLEGNYSGDISQFTNVALKSLASIVTGCIPMLATVFGIALISSIASASSSSFLKKQTLELISFVCYAAIIAVTLAQLTICVKNGWDTVNSLVSLMNAAFPVMLTLMTSLGGVAGAAAYGPMMALLSGGVVVVVTKFVFPMFVASMAIAVAGNASSTLKLNKLHGFFNSAAKSVLVGVFGLFVTILTIKGVGASVADGISIKSAKFALQSYVPLLGGYLSDGFDVVMASVVLVKNSVGIVVTMMIICAIAVPVLQLVATSLGLKLISGLIEPISDQRYCTVLQSLSKSASAIAEAVIAVGVAFLITIMLVVSSCNVGV